VTADGPLPEEVASEAALAAAEAFFAALVQRDGQALWDVLSETSRAFVLNIAVERGMDFELASRLRDGAAGDEERTTYQDELLEGILRDLRTVDLSRLAFESAAEPHAPMQVRVRFMVSLGEAGDHLAAVPAGSLLLTLEEGTWKVERLIPRPG
jgi:hypothetical protein